MDSNSSSSSSSSLPNFQRKLSKSRKSPLTPLLCILILFIANIPTNTSLVQSPTTTSNSIAEISYTQHCNEVVPESPNSFPFSYSTSTSQFLLFRTGFFSGGDRIFNQTSTDSPKSLTFIPLHSEKTASDGIFKVQATLNLRNPAMYPVFSNKTHRLLRQIRFRGPRRLPWRPVARFLLDGYWSESSGKLCMVGSFSTYVDPGKRNRFNAVLKLNYPINSSIYGSLIGGTLESLSNDKDDSNYFEPISIMGFKYSNHEYTFIEKENGSGCLSGYDGGENLSRNKTNRFVCPFPRGQTFSYSLEYGRHCGSGNCNPFGGSIRYLPNSMFYRGIWCWEGRKLQILLSFPNSSYTGYEFPFDPNTTLIAEAEWDEKENRLCGVACRILNVTESWANASVGDCSIGLSLIFPPVVSLRNRSTIVGEIQSRKHVNDSGYFGKIGFKSSQERSIDVQGLKYEYTEIENARKHCAKRKIRSKGKTYPNGYSLDMRFDMSISNSTGKVATGYSTPYFVGDQLYLQRYYGHSFVLPVPGVAGPTAFHMNYSHSSMLNISYKMSFIPRPDFKFGVDTSSKAIDISAEGIYSRDTGLLCMIGCRHLGLTNQNLVRNDSLDCEIMINIQFPPLHAKHGEIVKGTIESKRKKLDPLYFEPLQLSSNSITNTQAKASIWRMDLEIIMVLISNTLACVFVGLQLFYMKKHPQVLPFISIVMVIVLTLGHMIPLLLNFEALFMGSHNQTNVFLESGGWLEVNEVIVRVVTMVAFLLQLRLLQLTWSARQDDGSQKELWVSERKALYVALPVYIASGLIAWSVHQWRKPYQRQLGKFLVPQRNVYKLHAPSFWEDIKSYAGLLLDGFLLPQILFNLFSNSGEKALAPSFYIGTTIVRLLPHAYDLYRAHSSTWYLDSSYLYANHRMDFYSTAWDIIIPCGGLLFTVLVYLQQRFGGRCILPKRFRETSVYDKVSVISNDEL
ncbi:hypothetical protein I3842_09G060100 [Carya illinoinensis]|uniref:RING-type E3 ubiquitin transferase n=2 Tax=Carya illinoinensis TaxID=32201 RepID=A0A922E1E2_CARIL|nr:hypothetical protein I3842_09G060100 [Carya illinoinensis]